jgi:hypothetical protein
MAAVTVGIDAEPSDAPSALTECDLLEDGQGDPHQRDEVSASGDERAPSDADQCFNLATWVPSSPPIASCACDPYNVCQSTLLSEQCGGYSQTGVPVTHSYWVRITCPDLQFGWQLVTTTTTAYSAFCTISYKCGGSTLVCSATGTKHIKRRKVTYGPRICPPVGG